LSTKKVDRIQDFSEEEIKMLRDSAQNKLIQDRLSEIEKTKAISDEKSVRLQQYVSDMIKDDIKLSWNDLTELAIKFANEKDEEFYRFIKANYQSLKGRKDQTTPYVAPAATVVTTERKIAGLAIAIAIGIGWAWAWLAIVSPTSTQET
jgi:hypothetical protein